MLTLTKRGNWYHAGGKNKMGVKIPRTSTGCQDKDAADEVRQRWEKLREGEWPEKREAPKPAPAERTIREGFEKWLKQYDDSPRTQKSYFSKVMHGIIEPLEKLDPPVLLLNQITKGHLDDFQIAWKAKYTQNHFYNLRQSSSTMFNYLAYTAEWMNKNPWKGLKPPKAKNPGFRGKMVGEKKDKRIATLPIDRSGNENWLQIQAKFIPWILQQPHVDAPLLERPENFLALLIVMYETGLRRSDATLFRPDLIRPTKNGGFAYTDEQTKTGDEVTCFLTPELTAKLQALPCLPWRGGPSFLEQIQRKLPFRPQFPGAGPYPFYDGRGADPVRFMDTHIGDPLRAFGKTIPTIERALRPHRFRDQFAINCLVYDGLLLEELQLLLGHKRMKTTEDHYRPYVLGLQERLEARKTGAAERRLANNAQARAAYGKAPVSYLQ